MRVSMYFLHLELTFTPHYIITDKGLMYMYMYMYISVGPWKTHLTEHQL